MKPLSELGKILQLVITVAHHPREHEAGELAVSLGVSRATVYRYIKEARHLGVDLVRVGGIRRDVVAYEVRNWPQCRRRVAIWYNLELSRNVVDPQGAWV